MFHSDQECYYSSKIFRKALTERQIKQSMSRRGNCWDCPDGAVVGSLNGCPRSATKMNEASADVLRYLTHYYNPVRLHSHNGYRTPVAAETMAA